MTSRVSHTAIDCHNAYDLSEWWKQVLRYEDIPDDPNEPGHEMCMIRSGPDGHHLLFIEVPELKRGKNPHPPRPASHRPHPARGVRPLAGIGATLVADHRGIYGPGSGWYTMADPEGNEFCILHSDAERAQWLAARADVEST